MMASQFTCGDSGCDVQHGLSEGEAEKLSQQTSDGLRTAIAAEITSIAARGVSIGTLNELARFSHTAQELLMIRTPLAEVRRKKRLGQGGTINGPAIYSNGIGMNYGGAGGFAMSPYQQQYGYDEDDTDVDSLTQEAAQNETFGAKLTREVVSALGAMKRNTGPSVQELIDAIAQAKEAGLDKLIPRLEASLEEALGNEPGEPEVEPSKPPGRPRFPVPGLPVAAAGQADQDAPEEPPAAPQLTAAPTPQASQVMQ